MSKNLDLAVNAAIHESALIRAREGLLGAGKGIDAKRTNAWCEYGFPEVVTQDMLLGLHRRGGVAHGAVKKVANKCWATNPEVITGDANDAARTETPWEKELKRVITKRVWRAFADADRKRLALRFSALLLHIGDNKQWHEDAREGSAKAVLKKVTPVWQTSLKVASYDESQDSQTYGQPTMWQYTEAGIGDKPGRTVRVHPSRIFILGDASASAIAWLEPAYNAFVSLEKVEGGSGEAYLKNAARQIAVNFDKEIDFNNLASMYGVTVDELQDRFNDVARELNRGNDAMLPTQGATVTPLVANAPDPTAPYNVNLQTVAAAIDIPSKVLVGMQTGERASSEDQKYFNAMCQARREDLGFEIEDFVRHLQSLRVIGAAEEFAVIWDDLTEATAGDKLNNAKAMTSINKDVEATGQPIFADAEIRVAAGYEPELPEKKVPDDNEDEEDPAPANPAA